MLWTLVEVALLLDYLLKSRVSRCFGATQSHGGVVPQPSCFLGDVRIQDGVAQSRSGCPSKWSSTIDVRRDLLVNDVLLILWGQLSTYGLGDAWCGALSSALAMHLSVFLWHSSSFCIFDTPDSGFRKEDARCVFLFLGQCGSSWCFSSAEATPDRSRVLLFQVCADNQVRTIEGVI